MLTKVSIAQHQGGFDVNDYQWKNRLLITFSNTPAEDPAKSLIAAIKLDKEAFLDRNMVLITIYDSSVSKADTLLLNPDAISTLRSQYEMPHGTTGVVLVGKDGGVKLKKTAPTRLEEIYSLIDTMPMRRQEMRTKH